MFPNFGVINLVRKAGRKVSRSVEEKVEDYYKDLLDQLGVKRYEKTQGINSEINNALSNADSKSGGAGKNYPDIQVLLDNGNSRRIPVMIEVKGSRNKLEKLANDGQIVQVTTYPSDSKPGAKNPHQKGDPNYSTIQHYAVNGALHYGLAILDGTDSYDEVIIIGVNGTTIDKNNQIADPEAKAYYVSKDNNKVPKEIKELRQSWDLLKASNVDRLYQKLDQLKLTDAEIEKLTALTEDKLESRVKAIHQRLYDDKNLKTMLSTNQKLYLFTGLIMAGLKTEGVNALRPEGFTSNNDADVNDGTLVISRVKSFLRHRHASEDKIKIVVDLLAQVFTIDGLWKPINGESLIKSVYRQVYDDILPLLESNLHLDFTGKILNSLNDWVSIDNDRANDVVLTPRYVTNFMAQLARTNMDSFVWDTAMGSGGFLVSAMDIMMKDAEEKIQDHDKLKAKKDSIKHNQLLGVEILGNVYILAILNMVLMGDGSSNMKRGNSHKIYDKLNFPANVFLLNPPYSAEGKGLVFVQEALSQMETGYAAILIQENAGSGNGQPYAKNILKHNTLLASIHMPDDLFSGKASVQTAIYVFKVNRPHEKDDLVKFVDFSNDGYTRQNRKKSSQEVNLRDTDHAKDRYAEVLARVLGKKAKTDYYTEAKGTYKEDSISLNGSDWTFGQHRDVSLRADQSDFEKVVSDYLSFRVEQVLKGRKLHGAI